MDASVTLTNLISWCRLKGMHIEQFDVACSCRHAEPPFLQSPERSSERQPTLSLKVLQQPFGDWVLPAAQETVRWQTAGCNTIEIPQISTTGYKLVNLHRLAGLKYLEIKLRHYRSNNQWRTSNLCGLDKHFGVFQEYGTPLFQNSWFSPTPFGLGEHNTSMCSKSRFPCLFSHAFRPSLRLGLSWERNVVWTACARPWAWVLLEILWRCDDVISWNSTWGSRFCCLLVRFQPGCWWKQPKSW